MREEPEVVKASVRAKVRHPFYVVKNLVLHRKTRNRGLAKNTAQLSTLFNLANLVLARRRFATPATRRISLRAGHASSVITTTAGNDHPNERYRRDRVASLRPNTKVNQLLRINVLNCSTIS
jgi:hypothetical protein